MRWKNLTILPTTIITANGQSSTDVIGAYSQAVIYLVVIAVGGTTPTLDVKLQGKLMTGACYADTGFAFPQITAVGTYMLKITCFSGSALRLAWTVGGTNPSFKCYAFIETVEP